jgi:CheY-like chemotaxis protein
VHETKRHILIVEDDTDAREALALYLAAEGYPVLEAGDGREALERLRSSAVCLILLDLMMPTMNGFDFRTEQLRHPELADIPVVVVTADANAQRRASALGVHGFMVKPIQVDRLLDYITRYC